MAERREPVTLAHYLWTRLRQCGVNSVHGVPGDYNLNLLDCISSTGLHWVGSCNELNGGYAADGYARVKGMGAIVTTGGVGELSAINTHAGAYSEQVSLVHIVGSPALRIRENGKFAMHHTLGNTDFGVFKKMFEPISAAHESLSDVRDAPKQIDYALRKCWISSRPVYIDIPSDMANEIVEGAALATSLDLSYAINDKKVESQALASLQKQLDNAKRACFLLDLGAARQRLDTEIQELVSKSRIPTFVTPLAQGLVNESEPNHGGLYAGKGSHPGVQEFLESSDLVIHVGRLDTDVTTYLGSAKIKRASRISIFSEKVEMEDSSYSELHLRAFLLSMLDQLDFSKVSIEEFRPHTRNGDVSSDNEPAITQNWLWPYIGTGLEKGDIVLTDTGTASFGIFDTKLPPESMLINISLWASIGYSLPSAQGAALAAKDDKSGRRTIVFQGDGSFQLTCQEISTMIKHRLRVIIFIICNNGYTIERAVHDTREDYNDILLWNYKDILHVFDADSQYSRSFQVKTKTELRDLLGQKDFSHYPGVQLVELYTPELDVPAPLQRLADMITGRAPS
ncbi:hypothetical protein LTR10_015982 [Elasticomyces elasticus]|uniref:Pyruvate decarboxylase n=1 Tax=Exophiala sideris TaxID=1016849 RepID=A0ABR0J1R0_9EURO|nr:hypothetical protein LTR10_015982 [Elasticomyces elasticus]KAK5024680.1 hypothetical protein LTS07_008526 [Exophiala sideris]KAK5030773.1 hypothetical protein LTR13_008127 [Exophiala sideris]KAK5054314.1 hypothetical protein LTR69_008929 [Exophiala sideris]KAK5179716.1 hypothetical protein LTR44_007884 [Eurotiomycetes sp. CCFEE 6388]